MFQELVPYLPMLLVVLILVRRTQKSRRLYPKMLWITPGLFLLLGALYAFGAVRSGAHLSATDAGIVIAAMIVGAALGALRAHTVTLSRHAETGAIESKLSMWGLAVILAWLVVRVVLRRSGFTNAAEPFGLFNDATLALVVGSMVARSVVLLQRCAALEPHNASSPSDPSGEIVS